MFACPSCGTMLTDGDRFCRECGAPQVAPGAAQSVDSTGFIDLPADSGPIPVIDAHSVAGLGPGAAVLIVRRGPSEGARFVLEGAELLAGRAPESAIFLDDVTVSRRHATFAAVDGGWRVTDAGSLNGTYVNKDRIESTFVLSTGDEVQIGKYRFVYLAAATEDDA